MSIDRDGRRILSGVSLAAGAGTIHVIAGPNGAGKSTLLAAILGQIPFSGRIRLRLPADRPVAYVPQRFHVDRSLPLSVLDFLALGRSRRPACLGVGRSTRATAARLLERVGLPGFDRRMLGALSGGELQRVLLANALEPLPALLLLDEPAAGLDESSRQRLDALLVELRTAGATSLMVSHDFDQVRRLADRVTLIDSSGARGGAPNDVLPAVERALLHTARSA